MTDKEKDKGAKQDVKGDGKPPADPPKQEEPRTFTQEEVDGFIKGRADRIAAQKYGDYDALKDKAEKWAEFEESQKTELEKAQNRATELEAERDKALATGRTQALQAAVMSAAALAGAAHPGDAFALVDATGLAIGDDGKVTGADAAVKGLVEAGRLVLSGKPPAPGLDGGAGSGKSPGDKEKALTVDELSAARKAGVTPEQYAKAKKKTR